MSNFGDEGLPERCDIGGGERENDAKCVDGAKVSRGSITMQASTRVATRNLNGSIAEASIASICSVTLIEPSWAPMPAPTLPLTIKPVMIGPLSLTRENTITAGRKDLAPKRTRLSRVCNDITTPVAAPAKAINGSDFDPISSHWRRNSRNSYGGDR